MFWILIIAVPICIELAGWVVDATFLTFLLKEGQVGQTEDVQ